MHLAVADACSNRRCSAYVSFRWLMFIQHPAAATGLAAAAGLSKELEKALEDIEAAAAGSTGSLSPGSSVLDKEPAVKQQPKAKKAPVGQYCC